uniref:Reverse transcriptase domain-containing protein n=1 Tax=Cannabis sativa TaxID=3483 RepID=A0A803P0Z6_CANSA
MWKQRSREVWLSQGDRNSSFFHASTMVRRKRNHIWNLKDSNGSLVSNEREIGFILNDYFKSLFSSRGSVSYDGMEILLHDSVFHSENMNLIAVPEMEEIQAHVFQMHPLKAPGPDGLSGCFFRRCWSVVGADVTKCIQQFFTSGVLESGLNHTHICLIPKGINPDSVDRFRPIALCNFTYKIISRIIAQRMRTILDRIIAPTQSAFLPGRWIAESSILTQQIMSVIKKKSGTGGLMAIKMDLNKAYDRLEWNFLKEVLVRFGFHSHFVKIIMSCVTTVSYSILLNGRPLKKFFPRRGIRQGDPLSPYLFILCNEVFSRLLTNEQNKGLLHGIRVARNGPVISHLMFADDTIIFLRANLNELDTLNRCIIQYEDWSGQLCSKQKSGVCFSRNCSRSLRESIENGLNIGSVRSDEKHLGNPFLFSRSKRKDFNFLKTRLYERLEGWRLKTLSKSGRAVYVNSVALALPSYSMSTFQIPTSSCRDLDAIRGGLGFRRFEDINHALLSKLAWQLASNLDKPWCHSFKVKYFPRESFWSIQEKSSDSYVWKGILGARNIIAKGACSIIATGESIDIWWQPWIPWLEYDQFREIMEGIRCKAPSLKCVADLLYRQTKSWNIGYMHFLFGEELGNRIAEIQIVKNNADDMLIWKDSSVGKFSVKGAYWADQKDRFGECLPLWKWIWEKNIHPRLGMMIWRACMKILPTGDKFGSSSNCFVCLTNHETPLHLFARCNLASALWFSGPIPMRIDRIPGDDLCALLCNLVSSLDPMMRARMLVYAWVIMECIWKHRNQIVHSNGVHQCVDSIRLNVCRRFAEFDPAVDQVEQPPLLRLLVESSRVATDKCILVDGSYLKGKYGCAMISISKNSQDWWISASAGSCQSALEAEMFAVMLGLQWAIKNQWDDFSILTDSRVLVEALAAKQPPHWKAAALFSNILHLLSFFSTCHVLFAKRTALSFVDSMAKSMRLCEGCWQDVKGEGLPPVNPDLFWVV